MRKKNKIKIIVNGKQMKVNINISIKNVIDKLKMPISKVAIELNKEIINKKNMNKIFLKAGLIKFKFRKKCRYIELCFKP